MLDSTLLLALSWDIFLCRLPSLIIISYSALESLSERGKSNWLCCLFYLHRRSLWNRHADRYLWNTQSLVRLTTNNPADCNYSRGSVPESLEGRAAPWSTPSSGDVVLYLCGDKLAGGCCCPHKRHEWKAGVALCWWNSATSTSYYVPKWWEEGS